MKTTHANLQDAPKIWAILQQNLVDISSSEIVNQNHQNGFLIHNMGLAEIEAMILDQQNNLVLVVKNGDEVLGYLIASRLSALSFELQAGVLPSLQFNKIHQLEKIIYHRQIAVKPGFKGVGSLLLDEFLIQSKKADYQYAVCRIVHRPLYNQKSISFHSKFGFKPIGEYNGDNVVAGVYGLWI